MFDVQLRAVHPKLGEGIVRPLNGMYCGRVLVEFEGFVRWVEIDDLEFLD
jgi:hypothetical protein